MIQSGAMETIAPANAKITQRRLAQAVRRNPKEQHTLCTRF
jgi:hypothetical protein